MTSSVIVPHPDFSLSALLGSTQARLLFMRYPQTPDSGQQRMGLDLFDAFVSDNWRATMHGESVLLRE